MNSTRLRLVFVTLILTGCAHTEGYIQGEHSTGTTEVSVHTHDPLITKGDLLTVVQRRCRQRPISSVRTQRIQTTCTRVRLGCAEVIGPKEKDLFLVRMPSSLTDLPNLVFERQEGCESQSNVATPAEPTDVD